MIKVLFICHGNICRSTMAEYVMKYLVRRSVWSPILSSIPPVQATKNMETQFTAAHKRSSARKESRVAITVHARCVEKNMPHSTTSSAWSDTIYRTL